MVGILGYALLVGRHPFAHPTGLFSIPELIADPNYPAELPRPPSTLTSTQQRLFREYAAVVLRLLHREKAGRFDSASSAISSIDLVTPSVDCPTCSERVPDHHKFCGFCGANLTPAQPMATPSPAPETAESLAYRGFNLTRQQRWQEAIRLYQDAIKCDADYQRAYWYLGFALNHVGEHEAAKEALEQGLKLKSESPEHLAQFYYALAFANSKLKEYDNALEQANKALKYQPDSPRVLYLRAQIFDLLGRPEDSRRDASEVLQRDPDHAGALRLLEELDRDSGDDGPAGA